MTISDINYVLDEIFKSSQSEYFKKWKKIEIGRFRNLAKVDMYWKKELDGWHVE